MIAPLCAAGAAVLGVLGMVTLVDLGIFAGMYLVTALGITVGYHRLFTHRAFDTPRPVRWIATSTSAIPCV